MQPFASRFALLAPLLTLPLLGAVTSAAKADPMVPTVIIDVASGEVLQSEQATRPWYPASTTKLMTAYVALKEIQRGNVKFETPLVVSPHAAKQPPSKIGLKAGQEITVENALKILMVKSANDVSTVVAEGLGGSVAGFSAMMNREAARLGMRESHFVNPHGLHRDDHVSSARDMAILARALLMEFPQYSELWSIGAVQLGNRKYANTNGLIGRYPGAMGMKTGFVCASGFNLVSAAERNGRTLVAVVFGATSAADRTLKAAQLLDQGFSGGSFGLFGGSARTGQTLSSLTASFETRAPNRRAEICGRRGPPASDEDSGGALVAAPGHGSSDRPDPVFALSGTGQSNAVGQRVGNQIALGPRDLAEALPVYIGRKPGSTEIARRPGGAPAEAPQQAFAAEPKQKASGNPLALQAGLRPGAAAGIASRNVAAPRPGHAASLIHRGQAHAEKAKQNVAKLEPGKKDTAKLKAAPAQKISEKKVPGKDNLGKNKSGKSTPNKKAADE